VLAQALDLERRHGECTIQFGYDADVGLQDRVAGIMTPVYIRRDPISNTPPHPACCWMSGFGRVSSENYPLFC